MFTVLTKRQNRLRAQLMERIINKPSQLEDPIFQQLEISLDTNSY